MSEDAPEFISPPSTLKGKAPMTNDGVDLEALERAEQVIAGLQDSYLDWVQDDLTNLYAAYEKASAEPSQRQVQMEEVFRIAHDVKGQGGSFDYPLMTIIANHLCRFLEHSDEISVSDLQVVKLHIDSMKVVIARRMEGDGGEPGNQLIGGLEAVLAKIGR